MPLTPLDIRKKGFSSQLKGYSIREVKSFLDLVAKEVEELRKERGLLAEKVDELAAKLETHERNEVLLRDTLLTAQKATEEMRGAAEVKAEALMTKTKSEAEGELQAARDQAAGIVRDAEARLADLERELERLSNQRTSLLNQLRGIAQSFIVAIERWESTPAPTDEEEDPGER
jgi:cell division initiation protein